MVNGHAFQPLTKEVGEVADRCLDLAARIWARPELGMKEHYACAEQVKLLRELGFAVETPFAGRETGYCASMGQGDVTFVFMAEYDALPGLGHGCGHNLICTAAIAAGYAAAMKLKRERKTGRVLVMGTPGEESYGGKVLMMREGCLEGVDAAMMVHPSWHNIPDAGCLGIRRFIVSFRGRASHAGTAPELGLNALDAAVLLYNAVGVWRQQLPESSRVHGVIKEGGVVPNVIPAHTVSHWFLRAEKEKTLEAMEKRFRAMVRGAALMTGTRPLIRPLMIPYQGRTPNAVLNQAYWEAASAAGLKMELPATPGRGSSDFGNVSQAIPAIHGYFAISEGRIPGHSAVFAEAAAGELGRSNMLKAAAAMAAVGYGYLVSQAFRAAVRTEFENGK